MSAICEIFQSHELKWQIKDCEPLWNQNDQKTVLHNFNVYPDLDFIDAHGTSTYVKYTGADKIRELLLEIHKVIAGKANSKKEKEKPSNEALELPAPANGSNLPAVQGSKELATTQKPGLPATTQKPGLPAVTQKPGLPAVIPYDAAQYVKDEPIEPEEQKLLPAPEDLIKVWYCLTFEDNTKAIHQIEIKASDEKPKAETLVGTEIKESGKIKLASGPYETEEAAKKECAVEEKEDDYCNYYVTVKTDKLRMIEAGSGEKTLRFRYLMSNNMLKDLNGEKVSNADKFTITVTSASTGFTKLFGASFDMKIEDFQSEDPVYPGNLIVAIIPTLDIELSGNESLPSTYSPKTYNEVSARELRRRINELEFSDQAKTMTPEQKEKAFRTLLAKWEEDERRDKA